MSRLDVIGSVIGVLMLGYASWAVSGTVPGISGSLAGLVVLLAFCIFMVQKYGHLTIGDVIPKTTILKFGIWPLVLFAAASVLLIYAQTTQSFVLSFLGTTAFGTSFMFSTLAVIARNSENITKK